MTDRTVRLEIPLKSAPVGILCLASLVDSYEAAKTKVVVSTLPEARPNTVHLYASEKQPKPNVCSDFNASISLAKLVSTALPVWTQAADAEIRATLKIAEFEEVQPGTPKFAQAMGKLNKHLELRTFMVGRSLTIADLCSYGSLLTALKFAEPAPGLAKTFPHAIRWFRFISEMPYVVNATKLYGPNWEVAQADTPTTVQSVTESDPSKTKVADKEQAAADLAKLFASRLPGAVDGKVVTRFPPEPSGYLHIGHAKAAMLNAFYAKYFHGKMLLRFDDTNPSKEKEEFESSIIEDLKLLDVTASDGFSHTSDHFDRIQEVATELLKQGKAYVDKTPTEEMRAQRGEGIESEYRNQPADENLRLWTEMQKATEEGLTCCVRAKIDMKSLNKCLRDPVLYRCNLTPHHKHGDKYKVYPTYDFACPLVDSWEGVTHALRTNEYADRIPQYNWVQQATGVRPVTIYEFSRLNFVNTVLSKRKLQWIVDTKAVDGWDDPRFPTVRGIRRRGLTVEALLEFLLEQGPSKNVNLMEWDKLWNKNKQVLDPKVPRYSAVGVDSVLVILSGAPESLEVKDRPLHPKNESVGTCQQHFFHKLRIEQEDAQACTEGEEVTLMRWGNAIFENLVKDESGKVVKIEGRLNLSGDFKSTKKKLHWVVDKDTPGVKHMKCIAREYDLLILKKKPEEDDTMETLVNKNSLFETELIGEPSLSVVKKGDSIQLERRGYFICDEVLEDGSLLLFMIPDGKTKSMSTLSTKVDASTLSRGK